MPHVRPSIADKRRAFLRLHRDGCFVIPNPWDVGSARYLQTLGFKALATTSSGFAWSHGHRDGGMSRDRVLDHLTEMVEATDLPINADFEHGFAPDAAGSQTVSGSRWKPGWRDYRLKTRRGTHPNRCSISTRRWSECARPARPSIRPAATQC